jgi:hypothetical protein
VLLAGYALFVVAAGARSTVQLATLPHRALLAYTLSAVAAGVYAVGFVLLARVPGGCSTGLAAAWCAVEFAGVVTVGTSSLLRPDAFADATVWSRFGQGYGYLPLVLPVLTVCWLKHARTGWLRGTSGTSDR